MNLSEIRRHIETTYRIERGRIHSPGQFQDEMLYAPAAWEIVLNGFAEIIEWSNDEIVNLIAVDDDFRAVFPEIGAETVTLALRQTEQGFVICTEFKGAV